MPTACFVTTMRKQLPTFYGPAHQRGMYGSLLKVSPIKCQTLKRRTSETLLQLQRLPSHLVSQNNGLCLLGPFGTPGTNSSLKVTKIIHHRYSKQQAHFSKITSRSRYAVESNLPQLNHTNPLLIPIMFRELYNSYAFYTVVPWSFKLLLCKFPLQVSIKISAELFQKKKKNHKTKVAQSVFTCVKSTLLLPKSSRRLVF